MLLLVLGPFTSFPILARTGRSRWWLAGSRDPLHVVDLEPDRLLPRDEKCPLRHHLVSTLIVGVLSQAMANEPDLEWGKGRFTSIFPKLMRLFAAAYPMPSAELLSQ